MRDWKDDLYLLLMIVIACHVIAIQKDINKLQKAIVEQHVCHVVGNPEEMLRIARKK